MKYQSPAAPDAVYRGRAVLVGHAPCEIRGSAAAKSGSVMI